MPQNADRRDRAAAARADRTRAGWRMTATPESVAWRGVTMDLRLAGFAVAVWLSSWAGLHLAAGAGLAAASASAICGSGLYAWLRRPGPKRALGWPVLMMLGAAALGLAVTACRVANRDAPALAGIVHDRVPVQAELVVQDDPRPVRATSGGPSTYVVPARLTSVTPASSTDPDGYHASAIALSVRVIVLATDPGWRHLLPGQRISAMGRLGPARGGDLRAAVLSTGSPPQPRGRPPTAQLLAGGLRAGLQRACIPLPAEPGGLLPGLVVGDTSRLDPAVADAFRATGMTHLIAVSGSNVAIILGLALGLLRWCSAGPRLAAAISVLALVGFVILVRPSPSVLRAAAMGGLGLVALAAGRPSAAVPGLAAAVAVLVLFDPELAADPGFALSVVATGGLLLIAPTWRDALHRRGVPAGLAEALAVPASAQVACAPVIAAISGTVGIAAVPANLVAVPAVAPATVLGVGAAVLSPVWPGGAEFVAWLASWPARWLVLVAHYGAQVPAGALPWPAGIGGALLLAGLALALLWAGRHRVARHVLAVVAVAVVVGAMPVRLLASGWPPPGWLMVVCDVGQGDAVVLPTGPGQAVVVDAGPDVTAVDRCLHRLGVRIVPLLVITHFHADHVGGVAGVFRDRSIGTIITTGWAEPAEGRRLVTATAGAHGKSVSAPSAGAVYAQGPLHIEVLAPITTMSGTRSDPNNNSLVLLVRVRDRMLLLVGDAEEPEQQAILSALGADGIRSDVLKVAHHGSAYQDPAFLDAAHPRVALVSVGAGNSYGHPNPSVLAALARGGARVLRTDTSGDIAATLNDGQLAVVARGTDSGRHPP